MIKAEDIETIAETGSSVLVLSPYSSVVKVLRSTTNNPTIYGNHDGQVARVVFSRKVGQINLVPSESWANLHPKDVWSWAKLHTHTLPRMTLAAQARAIMKKTHAKAYMWPSQEAWFAAARAFYEKPKRGPIMRGKNVRIEDGVKLDIRGAYLWALQQGLPVGNPRLIKGAALSIPAGFDGFFDDGVWRGTIGERKLLDLIQNQRSIGSMMVWTLEDVLIPFGYDAIGKPMYQRAWVRHMPFFTVGRRFISAPGEGEYPSPDGAVLWRRVSPETGNPEVTAIIAARVRNRIHEITNIAEKNKLLYANTIVDSFMAERKIIDYIQINDNIGSWRVAESGIIQGSKSPTLYTIRKE